MRIYNPHPGVSYPLSPFFPSSCRPHLPRGSAIRHQRQEWPGSGGVVELDFHVPSVEGLLDYSSRLCPTSSLSSRSG